MCRSDSRLIVAHFAPDPCSHFVSVPPGVNPTDALQSTPLIHGAGGAFGGGVLGGGHGDEMDADLATALRVSAEEARAREESQVFDG